MSRGWSRVISQEFITGGSQTNESGWATQGLPLKEGEAMAQSEIPSALDQVFSKIIYPTAWFCHHQASL